MSETDGPGPAEPSILVSVFESLRRFDGLTADHLQSARAAPALLRLPVVQNQAVRSGNKPAAAAVEVVIEHVPQLESVTDRIIADVILNLGIYLDLYRDHDISRRALHVLQRGALGKRRETLIEHWEAFHHAHGATSTPDPPGEHTLRDRIEGEVFERLAKLLEDPAPVVELIEPDEPPLAPVGRGAHSATAGRVVVIGGVAMDHLWRIRSIPDVATSTMAMNYIRSPGGKGFSQAVAAAHLNLDVSLIAAIAADGAGEEIKAHLMREGVDTSLLRTIPNPSDQERLQTPATGILELPAGNSSAVVWRDGVELDSSVIDQRADAIKSCDVLLLTFEMPLSVLRHTLSLVNSSSTRPLVIVTPGQPYADGHLLSSALRYIDYLVAHLWELEKFAFSEESTYDPQLLSNELLSLGLPSLCLLVDRGGTVYRQGKPQQSIEAPPSDLRESSITRDAFCAALAARLADHTELTIQDIHWAAAAMACFAETYHRAPAHPLRETVDKKYRELFPDDD